MLVRMFHVGLGGVLLAALTVAGTATVGAARSNAQALLVAAFVNRAGPFTFLVDTGSTATMIDASVARAAQAQTTGRVPVATIAGERDLPATVLDELIVGGRRFGRVEVNYGSLVWLRGANAERIDGVVGQDVLRHVALTIDNRLGRLTLDPGGSCAPVAPLLDVAWANGRPMIGADVRHAGDRSRVRLVIDSGADALLLFADAVGRGNAEAASLHGAARARRLPLARVSIGGAWVGAGGDAAEVQTTGRVEDGLLPTSWFASVCLDGPRSLAVLEPR